MLLWATLAVLFVTGASKPEVCEEPPEWKANGLPMMRGNVTLVAFLTASESFSLEQAERLEDLFKELSSEDVTNITFFIVNLNSPLAELMFEDLEEIVSFPVYQDNDHDNIWKILEGGNQDIYIYDKCGRLTYYIPFPFSIIHPSQPVVSAALHSTYFEQLCGESCNSNLESGEIISDYNRSINHNYLKINERKNENNTDIIITVEVENNLKNTDDDNHKILVEDVNDEFINVLNNTNVTSFFNVTDIIDKGNETENIKNIHNEVPSNITIEILKEELNTSSPEVNVSSICEREYKEICPFWSKNRLKHMKKCCKFKLNAPSNSNNKYESFECRHVGNKRCKKMQPVIKCCLGPDFSNELDILNTTLLVTNETITKNSEDLNETYSPSTTKQPKKKSFLDKLRN